MLANLPVEIILLICEYPEFKDLGQLAWTNKRMMQIIKRYLPKALERKMLFYLYYQDDYISEGRICLFDSHTNSVEQIAKFTNDFKSYEVATTKDKIFAINCKKLEIFDLDTRQITRGPDFPEWCYNASIAYFKDKLYYLGGTGLKTWKSTSRVDILIDRQWETGPAFPHPISSVQTITCDGILYVIDGHKSRKIYRLSDYEREWIEVGELPEKRTYFGVASLNGKIYITGGLNNGTVFKSCWCFDPSAPVDRRISRIADMNYARHRHSLIVYNGKLYAIGGIQKYMEKFCHSIEEYAPQTNKWRVVGETLQKMLFYLNRGNNGIIGLFDSSTCSVEELAKFQNYYEPYQLVITQNKIFGINGGKKSLEIFNLNTRQISRGPDPPEWRRYASVGYFNDKLYYLGGWDPKTRKDTNQVDVLIDGKWQTGPTFPLPITRVQAIICDEILYVIDGNDSRNIYRLSDDEKKWIEIGKIPEKRESFGVVSLNRKIYITGGLNNGTVFKSCLCFDLSPSAYSRISRIADLNHERRNHSLIVANGKLYAIGGFQKSSCKKCCNSIEKYVLRRHEWLEVGKTTIK